MRKRMLPGLAVAAVLTSGLVVATSAYGANAATCTPTDGTPAKIGDWSVTGHTPWSKDASQPGDRDGESGQGNPANIFQIGAQETRAVEDTPATEIVVTPAHWQRYSWTGGPHLEDDAPAFPSDDWQPNVQGDPHKVGQEGAYFRSHGNEGNGDWFYLEAVPAVTQEVPAVTHTETRWAIETRVNTPAIPAVVCDDTTPTPGGGTDEQPPTTRDETPPTTGTLPNADTAPAVQHAAVAGEAAATVAHIGAQHRSVPGTAAVPTVIDAGL